ncbi:MAG TPA: hypothetical protein VGI14_10515 [Casimicrobiaceae bacterium]
MLPRLHVATLLVVACCLSACVVYEPVPVSQPTTQQRFDRSWAAAAGAMSDEGVTITQQDHGSGVIRGTRGNALVTASVQTLADGRIQVKFDAVGPSGSDTAFVHRLSDTYDRRMGR